MTLHVSVDLDRRALVPGHAELAQLLVRLGVVAEERLVALRVPAVTACMNKQNMTVDVGVQKQQVDVQLCVNA